MRARVAGSIALYAFLLQPALLAADSPSVERVLIRGTRRPLQLETRAGQPLDLDRIDRDSHRLWATGWFEDIRVESFESAGGLRLTFSTTDGSQRQGNPASVPRERRTFFASSSSP